MADSSPVAPTKLNAKRQKDDKDYHRHRLTDATFNPSESTKVYSRLCIRPRLMSRYQTAILTLWRLVRRQTQDSRRQMA